MVKNKEPALVYIDENYKIKLDNIKEKFKDDPEHYSNRLELKHIYLFSILLSLKNRYTPKKSKKKTWIFRTEYLKDEDRVVLNSLVFDYKKDITILLPEKYTEFYEITERLANAGMNKVLEILENSEDVEKMILIESKKFSSKK
tara:strand:+ start:8926 stop:9357 length:432 start_codon:yes stop_codon:yes gene_type:complete